MTNASRYSDCCRLLLGAAMAVIVLASPGSTAAVTCSAASGPELVPLLELYTSEGCDSCPAADRWLSSRFPPGPAGAAVSTLAFHVDYWDRLGWKDRFASPQFTERQYATMRANGATFVYTPQVVVQGRDVSGWQRGAAGTRISEARKLQARAALALAIEPGADGAFALNADANVTSSALRPHAQLWLAVTESGLVSNVKAGENRGVRLTHDHVVRALHGPFPVGANGAAQAALALRMPAERGSVTTVVAIVQDKRNGEVLQTLGLPVCNGP